ncbi:MAG: biopolymer transporter ExbD [Pirellulaceae bacterium]
MGIKFQCPSCKAIRAANERLMGREIKCPECGSPVQLPSLEQIQEARALREQQQRERQEQLEHERRLQRILAPVVGVEVEVEDEEDVAARISAEEKALAAASATFVRPKPPQSEDMDMTPMVDVTFLLLIFFMITASFSVQKAIQRPAQLKDDPSTVQIEQPPEDPADIVTVQVDEFNAYNVLAADWDRPAGSKQDLIVALNEAHGGSPAGQPSKLIIEAHENCIHAAVIAALDAGREAKFESFEVSTVEQFD